MKGCLIKNWQTRSIPGGWSIEYVEGEHYWQVGGPTPQRIVDKIVQIQTVNGTYTSEDAVWEYCNAKWAAKVPDRALVRTPIPASQLMPKPSPIPLRDHWKSGPERHGPILWFWLHSFGTVFNKEHWEAALDRVDEMLSPERSPMNGCERCHNEWMVLMKTERPLEVSNEKQAAEWTWNAHNRINKKLGKKPFPFSLAAKMYGWKVDL